jgi:hypothetical protein
MPRRKTAEESLKACINTHGDRYDYSKFLYKGYDKKVCIICREHGIFFQDVYSHIKGSGCPKCGYTNKSTSNIKCKNEFIKKAKATHLDVTYDYTKSVYSKSNVKLCIICSKHGEFWQTPSSHLSGGGCPKCKRDKLSIIKSSNVEKFIKKAVEVHKTFRYDYSNVMYVNNRTKIIIICPVHGKFYQSPMSHLRGSGCFECGKDIQVKKRTSNNKEFISRAENIYRDKYDYSKVVYINALTKVCIICSKHGEFFQEPHSHLQGHECPTCYKSTGENFIKKWLDENNIKYIQEYKYNDLRGLNNHCFEFDFYIPSNNILIEFDGQQHFKPVRFNGMSKNKAIRLFKQIQVNDALKNKYCIDNNIPLLRISYKDFKRIPEILSENIFKLKIVA